MPSAKVNLQDIAANSFSTFVFLVKGDKVKNGIKLKFKIIPDIIDGEPDYLIETKSFCIFVNPI